MKKVFSIFFFLLLACIIQAQKPKQYLSLAERSTEANDYVGAAYYFLKAYELDSSNMEVYNQYAHALLKDNNYQKAEKAFQYLYYSKQREGLEESLYYLALCQQYNAKYNLAQKGFERFTRFYKGDESLIRWAEQREKSCWYALQHQRDSSAFELQHLPRSVNTIHAEFAPWLSPDSTLLFSALRYQTMDDRLRIKHEQESGVQTMSIDLANPTTLTLLDTTSQKGFAHVANFTPGLKLNTAYCKACDQENQCALYRVRWKKDSLWDWRKLPPSINTSGADNTHPVEVEMGTDTLLLFSSNRSGGAGGYDLYYTKKQHGEYLEAKNMGTRINSMGNEITPDYQADSNRLYFASDWHKGYGGYDVFFADGRIDSLSKPQNAMLGINSSANDLYLRWTPAKNYGVLVSNRSSGIKLSGETCCNDMYLVHAKPPRIAEDTSKIEPDSALATSDTLEPQLKAPLPSLAEFSQNPFVVYFANDHPNPRSWESTTEKVAENLVNEYIKEIKHWEKESEKDTLKALLARSSDELQRVLTALKKAVEKGDTVLINIKGFASPLHVSTYNLNLSKRRIQSFVNHLQQDSLLNQALLNKQIRVKREPMGEAKGLPSYLEDRNNTAALYSLPAFTARRIEILLQRQ